MAHFAKIENNLVVKVIVADEPFVSTLTGVWVQTSYNTSVGKYKLGKDRVEKDANRLLGEVKDVKARDRKNYAGIGYTYDSAGDMFIAPKPYGSWKLKKDTGGWEAPNAYPKDGADYDWNEELLAWVISL